MNSLLGTTFRSKSWLALVPLLLLGAVLAILLMQDQSASGNPAGPDTSPTVQWVPPIIDFPDVRRKGSWLIGSGFEPNQDITVQLIMGGVETDIAYLLSPVAVPDELGAFASAFEVRPRIWKAGQLVDGPVTINIRDFVTDELLTSAPLVFCDRALEKLSKWCAVSVPAVPTW